MDFYKDKAQSMLVNARVDADRNELESARVWNEIAKTYIKLHKIENHERFNRNPVRTESTEKPA